MPRRGKTGTILIIDPRSLTRESITHWLKANARGLRVQAAASFAAVRDELADDVNLAVLNIGAARVSDPEIGDALDALRQTLPDVPIAVVADRDDCSCVTEALGRGVRGYIPTSLSLPVMIEALRLVRAGGTFVPVAAVVGSLQEPAGRAEPVPPRPNDLDLDGFTPRQMEVLTLLRQGKPNKLIAYELAMQQNTVKVHVRHIMAKLKATNRTQAAFLANLLFAAKESVEA